MQSHASPAAPASIWTEVHGASQVHSPTPETAARSCTGRRKASPVGAAWMPAGTTEGGATCRSETTLPLAALGRLPSRHAMVIGSRRARESTSRLGPVAARTQILCRAKTAGTFTRLAAAGMNTITSRATRPSITTKFKWCAPFATQGATARESRKHIASMATSSQPRTRGSRRTGPGIAWRARAGTRSGAHLEARSTGAGSTSDAKSKSPRRASEVDGVDRLWRRPRLPQVALNF